MTKESPFKVGRGAVASDRFFDDSSVGYENTTLRNSSRPRNDGAGMALGSSRTSGFISIKSPTRSRLAYSLPKAFHWAINFFVGLNMSSIHLVNTYNMPTSMLRGFLNMIHAPIQITAAVATAPRTLTAQLKRAWYPAASSAAFIAF